MATSCELTVRREPWKCSNVRSRLRVRFVPRTAEREATRTKRKRIRRENGAIICEYNECTGYPA